MELSFHRIDKREKSDPRGDRTDIKKKNQNVDSRDRTDIRDIDKKEKS
jgi:hypothetical protein